MIRSTSFRAFSIGYPASCSMRIPVASDNTPADRPLKTTSSEIAVRSVGVCWSTIARGRRLPMGGPRRSDTAEVVLFEDVRGKVPQTLRFVPSLVQFVGQVAHGDCFGATAEGGAGGVAGAQPFVVGAGGPRVVTWPVRMSAR